MACPALLNCSSVLAAATPGCEIQCKTHLTAPVTNDWLWDNAWPTESFNMLEIQNCDEYLVNQMMDSIRPHLPYIHMLVIMNCLLTQIPQPVEHMDNLYSLVLPHNALTELHTIPGNHPKLLELRLENNKIRVINSAVFKSAFHIDALVLQNNKLTNCPPEIWRIFKHRKFMDFSGNLITELDASILFMNGIVLLNDNAISHGRPATMSSKCPNDFIILSALLSVKGLSNNNITYISDLFNGWGFDREETMCWIKIGVLKDISFADNNLICDCVDCHIYQALIKFEQKYHKNHGYCSINNQSKMTKWGDLTQEDVNNMYCDMTDCPDGCICRNYACQHMVRIECHNSTSPLPQHLPQLPDPDYYYTIDISEQNSHRIMRQAYFNQTKHFSVTHCKVEELLPESLDSLCTLVEHLDLHGNNLTSLPKTDCPHLKELYLHDNPWHCDCNLKWMKYWIVNHVQTIKQTDVKCASPFYHADKSLVDIPDDLFLCWWTIVGSVLGGVLTILAATGGLLSWHWRFWLYLKYGFHPFDKDECTNEEKKFDVFLSYSNHDDIWSRELMKRLKQRGYKICCHEEDFLPGVGIAVNIEKAVHYSKRTLCVVSRNFINSPICLSEFDTARSFDMCYNKNRLIMILYEDIPDGEMPESIKTYVKSYTYLKRDSPLFMKRLMYMLAQNKILEVQNPDEGNPFGEEVNDERNDMNIPLLINENGDQHYGSVERELHG